MNLKTILPIEHYTLQSNLSIEEIRNRLSEIIAPKQAVSFSLFKNNSTKPYEGEVAGNTFSISRIINYRNSFLPFITGRIDSYSGQTFITIEMRMFMPVIIFMCIWLGATGLVGLLFLLSTLFKLKEVTQQDFSFVTFVPLIMFLFGWLLMFFAFKAESKKSKQFLLHLLEGEEKSNYQNRIL